MWPFKKKKTAQPQEETWQQKWERENPAYEKLRKALANLYTKEVFVSSSFFEMYINERKKDTSYGGDKSPMDIYRGSLFSGKREVYGNEITPIVLMTAQDWKPPIILDSVDLSEEL